MSDEWARELAGECDALTSDHALPLVPALQGLWQVEGLPQEAQVFLRLLLTTGHPWRKVGLLRWSDEGLQCGSRPVAIDPATLGCLRRWAQEREPGPALEPYLASLPGWLGQAAEAMGVATRFVSCGRKLTPQLLRHHFAVGSLEAGMDLLILHRLMGHQDLNTTQMYIAVAIEDCHQAYLSSHPLAQLGVRKGKKGKKPQACPTVDESLALIEAPRRARDRLMLRLLYASGLRVSELLSLAAGDIDGRGRLFIRGGKGGGDRYAVLDPESLQRLQQYALEQPAGLRLFRTTRAHLHSLTVRAARELGLLDKYQALGLSLSPHSFRHACASHCYEQGMALEMVRKMLGHAYLRNTLLYIDWPDQQLRLQFLDCHPWANGM